MKELIVEDYTERLKRTDILEVFPLYDFDGLEVSSAVNKLNVLYGRYRNYSHLTINISCEDTLQIIGERLETDEEYAERMERHRRFHRSKEDKKAEKERKEKEMYLKLKNKFEKE